MNFSGLLDKGKYLIKNKDTGIFYLTTTSLILK